MNLNNKKTGSLTVMLLVILGLLYQAVYYPTVTLEEKHTESAAKGDETCAEGWKEAEKELILWYTDEDLTGYLESCAQSYYEKKGIAVGIECVDKLGYLETVYQNSIDEDKYPDLYLAHNDSLEKAYLYGIAEENPNTDLFETGYAHNAVSASEYDGKMYGYPLSFNTPVFIYHKDVFAETPGSLQAIIDFASENELGNGVASLIEWNINDEFLDFTFVGSGVQFSQEKRTELKVNCDEEQFTQQLAFLQGLAEVITIDSDTMTREQVLDDFNEEATATAIIDSDDLKNITSDNYATVMLPMLNEAFAMKGCAQTEMVLVNSYSSKEKEAEEFAAYITLEKAELLETMSGRYSVCENALMSENSKVAFSAYEQAINMPSSMDSNDFWKELRQRVVAAWNGGVVGS